MRPLITRTAALLALLLPLLLAGCGEPVSRALEMPADLPRRAAVDGVPLIRQDAYFCGPTSLAMVMQWSGHDVTQAEIAGLAFSPGARGTYRADMLGAARRQGQLAVELTTLPALLDEVSSGHPVIVFQNLGFDWAPRWHYGVVVGYDLRDRTITLHSGERERMVMPLAQFRRTWRRGEEWAIVVLPPDRLPASSDEWAVLRAAAALERAGRPDAAAETYARGRQRWPGHWIWPYGTGNARYAMGDLVGARRAFARAVALDPGVPEARNNLVEVTRELGG